MKQTHKYVMIDLGYGIEEYWVPAKVLNRAISTDLFTDSKTEILYVKACGEQLYVTSWKEVDDTTK